MCDLVVRLIGHRRHVRSIVDGLYGMHAQGMLRGLVLDLCSRPSSLWNTHRHSSNRTKEDGEESLRSLLFAYATSNVRTFWNAH